MPLWGWTASRFTWRRLWPGFFIVVRN